MTGTPAWSVVIPTFNRLGALKEVLEALDDQQGPRFEVLVVDDGSTDGTASWLDERAAGRNGGEPELLVLHQANRGPAAARNRGVAAARGRWVAFLGDDTVPAPGWLAEHRRAQEAPLARSIRAEGGCVGVIGRTDWHQRMRRTPFLDYINENGLQFGFALIENADDVPFNFFYTSNLSIEREAMAAEPFDAAFPFAAWEDIEAAYRLSGRGLRLLYRPEARVAHDHPTGLLRFAKRQYRAGYSAVVFYRRHEQLGPFLGFHDGAPPPVGGVRDRAVQWLQERLARTLQRLPVRLPRLWERTMRYRYLEGLRDGWSDDVGLDRRSASRLPARAARPRASRLTLPLAALLGLGLAAGAEAAVGGTAQATVETDSPRRQSAAHRERSGLRSAGRDEGAHRAVLKRRATPRPRPQMTEDRSRRRHGDRGGRRARVHVRPGYGFFGWRVGFGPFWPHPYSPHYHGYGPHGWGSAPVGYPDAGALDINTRPRKASVYIDGELVGRVDGFDGFPRYLWLRDGSYRLTIFMEGYRTLERQVRVQPGVVIRIDEDLVPGTAERPRPAPTPPPPAAASPAPEGESWRVENRGRPIDRDQRTAPARLRLEVEPADAVVYLDGRLLGSGAELASLHSALMVDPGAHRLEAMRPGYVAELRTFEAAQGEDVTLRIVLREE